MRIAMLSDVHGNVIALGSDPAAVLERLGALPNAHFTRGNTDRYALAGPAWTPRERGRNGPSRG